jgi:hypothetical protein
MHTADHRIICLVSLLSLAFACTTEPTPAPQTAKQPQAKPDPSVQQEPSPQPEPPTTANPTLDPPPPEPEMPPVDGFFMAEGAPPPRGCASASDCLGDTIPDVDNPCCQNPRTLEPHARAYRSWVFAWRKDHCASVTCPPPPAPSEPPECAFEVDCVQGQCVDACE